MLTSYFNILRTSFKKDFLFQYSYKLSFFTELVFAFLLIFFLFFLSKSFNFSDDSFYSKFKGEFFLFSITGLSVVNLMGQCYAAISTNLREAQSFGYIEELFVSKNRFVFLSISSAFYTFVKSFLRLLLIFIVSWALSDQTLLVEDIFILLAVCCITLVAFIGISMIGLSIILIYKKGDYLSLIFVGGSLIISGAIYPNNVLPQSLIYISELLPLTHTLDIIRNELVEEGVGSSSYHAALKLIFLSIIYLVIGYTSISKAIDISRKKGTFSHY
jgi:ABC-2 type transport system permease protein